MPRHRFTDTKERIEQAAIALFVKKGVAETTVRDIAQAVDMSEGALYRHFVGKEELVWQLFERHYVAFAGRLQALADGEATVQGKLAAMIRGFCQAHDDDPALFHFLLFVQHGQLSKLSSDTPTPVTVMHALLSHAIDDGELPAQDANLATALAMGIVLQPVTFAAYGRLPQVQAPNADRLIAAAWAAVTTVDREPASRRFAG
jgi:AcrR family transcriptional regulator